MTQHRSEAGFALPVELTHFVGRERELATLGELARSARLLTLTGAGGSGKSRIALHLLRALAHAEDERAAWVELAPLDDPALLPGAVLRSLGTPADGNAATVAGVADVIRGRSVTLVLDNCEHLIDACAALADALLRACPRLRIIATSREALGIAGERAWLLPPMDLPPEDAPLHALEQCDSIRLFVDRARDVVPDFTLTAANARDVALICARVDGIPLAIELAAARVRHLSPEQMRHRLSDAFALLTSGSRTALPRQRTLRATIDWSHELLPDPARIVFRRLAVFRGGFTLDMVEHVATGDVIDASAVLDLVGMLADRSLIVVREQNGVARYHLLETMRQYAFHKLREAGEVDAVHRRLAAAVAELVERAEPAFTTAARREAFGELAPELDNIREVLGWTRTHDARAHVRLVGQLWWFWYSTHHWVEAGGWITDALALPESGQPGRDRAALLFASGALSCLRGETNDARPRLEEAARLAAHASDEKLHAYATNYIAMTYAAALSPAALEYAERAEQWLRANHDAYGLRLALLLGGMALQGAGDAAGARRKMEEAVAIARSFGQDRELAIALQTYATVLSRSGDRERAAVLVHESLQALQRDPSFLFIARAVDYVALGCADEDPERAARVLGIAEAVRRHIGAGRFDHDEAVVGEVRARLVERLGGASFERAFSDGFDVAPLDAAAEALRGSRVAVAAEPAPAPMPASAPAPTSDDEVSLRGTGEGTAHDHADVSARLLGSMEVFVRGQSVEQWPYAKPRELLALLLLHPAGRSRVEIGAALWPGAAPAQVRNSFHVTMHHLRKVLGHADWVVLDGERYRIAPTITVSVDVEEFRKGAERLLGSGQVDAAAIEHVRRLYRGHLLAEESAGAWKDELQDALRRLFCDVMTAHAEYVVASAGDAAAIEAWETVIAAEPLHEPAHRGLIAALVGSGQRAQALRHYERFATLLRHLELEPEPETEEMIGKVRAAG